MVAQIIATTNDATTIVVVHIIEVDVMAVAAAAAAKIKPAVIQTRNSHAIIAGRNLNVARTPSMMISAATAANSVNTAVAGMRNVAATLITPNWGPAMKDSSRSFSVLVILVLTLTNTRIYPWKRRAKMSQQTSHPSMMSS